MHTVCKGCHVGRVERMKLDERSRVLCYYKKNTQRSELITLNVLFKQASIMIAIILAFTAKLFFSNHTCMIIGKHEANFFLCK